MLLFLQLFVDLFEEQMAAIVSYVARGLLLAVLAVVAGVTTVERHVL
jgi:hypothetical protein